jgi:Uma2 family endonuclease
MDTDADDHLIESNSYDPICFRLVLEVTSSNYRADLRTKVRAYAQAEVPLYVIVDREHDRLHVLTDPDGAENAAHRVHSPGESVVLPASPGAGVVLDVEEVLGAGRPQEGSGQS